MNTGADLTILVPLWKRSTNLLRLMRSVHATVPDAEVLLIVSRHDTDLQHLVDDMHLFDAPHLHLLVVDGPGGTRGDYACKINAGYRHTARPVLFTGADDIEFTSGWYDTARALLGCAFGDPTCPCQDGDVCHYVATADTPALDASHDDAPRIGVVGTNDGCNSRTFAGEHSTHSLVARWYANAGACVDRRGLIYCEGYWHEYCDDELVQTAKMRGMYAHALDALVQHHHPNAALAPDDETYQRGRTSTRRSRNLYRQRAALWQHGTNLWAD